MLIYSRNKYNETSRKFLTLLKRIYRLTLIDFNFVNHFLEPKTEFFDF